MQRRFVYIVNPVSGTRSKNSLQTVIENKTRAAGYPYRIFPSVAGGDYSFLQKLIREEQVTDVVIAGGDGTVNAVVNGLKACPVQFGIIPCGSGNGLAFSAGLPKNWTKALDIIFNGRAVETDAFTVNDRFACMLCGLGFDAQVAYDFAANPKRGLLTYVKQSVKNFFTARPYSFTLETGGNEWETEAFLISVANSNQFGNNVTIAPQASLNDGLLDVVIVTKQNKLRVLLETAKQLTGWNKVQQVDLAKQNRSVIYFQTDGLKIENPELAPLHIDGEPTETAEKIKIKILAKCFKLVRP